jgi:hypothetical protein
LHADIEHAGAISLPKVLIVEMILFDLFMTNTKTSFLAQNEHKQPESGVAAVQ